MVSHHSIRPLSTATHSAVVGYWAVTARWETGVDINDSGSCLWVVRRPSPHNEPSNQEREDRGWQGGGGSTDNTQIVLGANAQAAT